MIIILVVIKTKCVLPSGTPVDIPVVFHEGLTSAMKGTWRMCIPGLGNEGTAPPLGFSLGSSEHLGRSVTDLKAFA